MVAVPGEPVADHFGVDPGAATAGVLELLQDQDARPFPRHEPVAVAVKRPRGPLGLGVARGQRLHGIEPGDAGGGDDGFGAAGDHGVGPALLDDLERVAHRVGAGGAGGRQRQVGPLGPEEDRDHPRRHVADHHGDEKGADALGAVLVDVQDGVLHEPQPAQAAPRDHAHPVAVILR